MPAPPPPDPTDDHLIARAINGDRDAFGDLYERHLSAIYRYVYYRVGEAREAEDVTEMIFLKAWEALERYRPTGAPFRVWLYRIAHNVVVDRYRTRKTADALDEQHPDRALHPEAHVERDEGRQALLGALARLDPAHQQVLTLRFMCELSHAETALTMGRSEGAVRVLQHRALAALRALLNGTVD
jgi:RNA polymerase sigma-70 factor (ECF subfamily)